MPRRGVGAEAGLEGWRVKQSKISELKFDKKNANKGTQRGAYMLEESLRKYGAGRSILLDKNGCIIAGNKTIEQAGQLGIEDVIVIPSDGTKIVAVQRTDLDLEKDTKARELAYADNRVQQIDLDWDVEQLLQDVNDGVDLSTFWKEDEVERFLNMEKDLIKKETNQTDDENVDLSTICCPKCGYEWVP